MLDVRNSVDFYWDPVIAAGSVPGFFELKRARESGPIFGKRSAV